MKKALKYIGLFVALFLILIPYVSAANLSKEYALCHDVNILKGLRIVGYVIMVLKILTPIVLIIMGMYSFFKATLDDNDKATREAVRLLIVRFCVAAIIFFIPTIINAVFSLVSTYDKSNSKYTECMKCITSVKSCNNSIDRYK